MEQKQLNAAMMLHIHKEKTDQLSVVDLGNTFASTTEHWMTASQKWIFKGKVTHINTMVNIYLIILLAIWYIMLLFELQIARLLLWHVIVKHSTSLSHDNLIDKRQQLYG